MLSQLKTQGNNKSNKTTKKYLMSLTNEKNTSFIGYLALMKNENEQEKNL